MRQWMGNFYIVVLGLMTGVLEIYCADNIIIVFYKF